MCSGRRRLTGSLEYPSAQLPTLRSPPLPSRKKRPTTHPTRTHCLRLSRMREASPAGSPWGRDGRGSRWHISGGRARALLWSIASRGPAGRTCWAGTSSAPGGGGRAQEWGEGREREGSKEERRKKSDDERKTKGQSPSPEKHSFQRHTLSRPTTQTPGPPWAPTSDAGRTSWRRGPHLPGKPTHFTLSQPQQAHPHPHCQLTAAQPWHGR